MAYIRKISFIFAALFVFNLLNGSALAKEETYSGVYKEKDSSFQMFPNAMATLCKISAKDVVEDRTKLTECINKLVNKRRSSNAETAREGLKDINEIKTEQMQDMLALAIIKSSEVADYYAQKSDEVVDFNKGAKTVNDQDGAAINTNSVLTKVINNMNYVYAEQLKYLAISNFEDIEKDVLNNMTETEEGKKAEQEQEEARKAEAEKNSGDGLEGADETVVETKLKAEIPGEEVKYIGNGTCQACYQKEGESPQCQETPCPDGTFDDPINSNIKFVCRGGQCNRVEIPQASSKPELPKNNKVVADDVVSVSGEYVDTDWNGNLLKNPYISCTICKKNSNRCQFSSGICPDWIKPLISANTRNLTFNCSNGLCE